MLKWVAGLRTKLQLLEIDNCSHARQSASYRPPASLRHWSGSGSARVASQAADGLLFGATWTIRSPFDQGGRTCWCNLAPACRRHHGAKQAPGWHLEQLRPGEMTWRMPSGRTYQTAGERYPV